MTLAEAWTAVMTFLQHPIVILLGLVIGIVGIVLTIRSGRARKPRWTLRSNNLISQFAARLSELEIKYGDRKVENLTITKVLFWNAGAETIDRRDVAEADPLCIVPVGATALLDAKVLKANSDASRFAIVGLADGSTALDFDFLDKNQGAIIQVIHSGRSSKDLMVRGTVKGAGAPKKRNITTYSTRWRWWLDTTPNTLLLGVLGAVGVYLGYKSDDFRFVTAGATSLLTFVAYMTWRYWDARLPPGLEEYARD